MAHGRPPCLNRGLYLSPSHRLYKAGVCACMCLRVCVCMCVCMCRFFSCTYKLPSKPILTLYVLLDQLFLGDSWRLHIVPGHGHQAVTIPELSFPSLFSGYPAGLQPPDTHMAAFGGVTVPFDAVLGLMHFAGGCNPALLTSCETLWNYLVFL